MFVQSINDLCVKCFDITDPARFRGTSMVHKIHFYLKISWAHTKSIFKRSMQCSKDSYCNDIFRP